MFRHSFYCMSFAIALLLAAPALADVVTSGPVSNLTGADAAKPVTIIGGGAGPAPAPPSVPAQPMYRDLRQQLSAQGGANPAAGVAAGQMVLDPATFGSRMIGLDIRSADGNVVGRVEDITLDGRGVAQKLLVRDGGYFGYSGKLVALDYNAVGRGDDGSFSPVDKNQLRVTGAYDRNSDTVSVHVADLRGANLKSPTQETMGNVDDVVIADGQATGIVLTFNPVLGFAGDKAVMNFTDATVVNKGASGTFVQLNSHQSDTLRALKTAK